MNERINPRLVLHIIPQSHIDLAWFWKYETLIGVIFMGILLIIGAVVFFTKKRRQNHPTPPKIIEKKKP